MKMIFKRIVKRMEEPDFDDVLVCDKERAVYCLPYGELFSIMTDYQKKKAETMEWEMFIGKKQMIKIIDFSLRYWVRRK